MPGTLAELERPAVTPLPMPRRIRVKHFWTPGGGPQLAKDIEGFLSTNARDFVALSYSAHNRGDDALLTYTEPEENDV